MIEKQQPIVALGRSSKPKKARPPRNNLLLSLKKNDLELNFYSSLDPEIMNKLLESLAMIKLSDLGQVYIVCGKTDLRKGIDGLATLVKEQFELDPFSGKVFLFCGGSKDRFKALYWDGQGFWLLYKRFENGKLNWPRNQNEVQALSSEQVDWLMKGFAINPKIKNTKACEFY